MYGFLPVSLRSSGSRHMALVYMYIVLVHVHVHLATLTLSTRRDVHVYTMYLQCWQSNWSCSSCVAVAVGQHVSC